MFDAATGHPVSFNREARRIVEGLRTPGRPPEQLLEVITCRHADGREVSLEELPLARQLGSATTMRAEEVELSVPDGRSVRMLINVTPIRSEEGGVVSVVVTMQDLAPLDELERQRAEFLGMVSHELRAPLTSIKGSTATVLGAVPVPPQAELLQFFRIIDGQADHMRGLIANLLDAGSIEAGTLTVAPEPANVAALVDRARSTFLSGGGRHAVLIDLPPDLPRAMADPERIVQVMNNLLSNAARHAPASSPIRVEAAHEGGYIALSVSDEGRGTDQGRALHLHDPGGRGGHARGSHARGGSAQRPAAPARGRAGEDSRPGRGRRPADAPLRARRPLRCGLRPAGDGAIRAALREGWTTLRRRLEITDSRSPEHLSSECLVHLFRDAHRKGDDRRTSAILPVLLGRCEAILKTKILDSERGASEMREEVLSRFGEVLASDGVGGRPTELDMYECRFNRAFHALRFDVVDRERRRLGRTAEVPRGDDGDERLLSEEEGLALLSKAGRTPATQERCTAPATHVVSWEGSGSERSDPRPKRASGDALQADRQRCHDWLRGRVVGDGRYAPRLDGRGRVQACRAGPHLPQVHHVAATISSEIHPAVQA